MSNFADEERELAERELEDERYFASHCTTYDELREVRMGIVPAHVLARAKAASSTDAEASEVIDDIDGGTR